MNAGDVLMKKWCFGMGRSKAREEAVQGANGEVNTYVTYPKYRTIVFKVDSANKNGEEWTVKGKQFASLKAPGKAKTIKLTEKNGCFYPHGQKRPFLKVQNPDIPITSGLPPVGSLISVNKKHAIVTEVGRNSLTVYVNNAFKTITCKPGTIKWFSDKVLLSAMKESA
tara:strand:- start:4513 stop:5016 length:504 start_codon:yes stop_codon:yes gene_type:complete